MSSISFLPFFGFEITNAQWLIILLPVMYSVTIGLFISPELSFKIWFASIFLMTASLIYSAISELFGLGFAFSLSIGVVTMLGIAILIDVIYKKDYFLNLIQGLGLLLLILFFLFLIYTRFLY
tara:strand:+ start:1501 stop:1869 length:369 start_codon:yes stop_codon:yes gene_type:complete